MRLAFLNSKDHSILCPLSLPQNKVVEGKSHFELYIPNKKEGIKSVPTPLGEGRGGI